MTFRDAIQDARSGRARTIHCPAHEDHSPSLSVKPGRDGAVLIKCFAGCRPEAVLQAAGLCWADVCSPRENRPPISLPACRAPAEKSPSKSDLRDDTQRAEKRSRWPQFRSPDPEDLARIASIRGLAIDGLKLSVRRGLLRVAEYGGHPCWIVTDDSGMAAQARRLDGEQFQSADGPKKALTLPGSYGTWLVGSAALETGHRSILLVEGGPDLLTAHQYIFLEGRQHDAAAVAMLGAAGSLRADALTSLKRRKVRIVEHNDKAGSDAGVRWAGQLRGHVASVDGISFAGLTRADGRPVNDLNDSVYLSDADLKANPFMSKVVP